MTEEIQNRSSGSQYSSSYNYMAAYPQSPVDGRPASSNEVRPLTAADARELQQRLSNLSTTDMDIGRTPTPGSQQGTPRESALAADRDARSDARSDEIPSTSARWSPLAPGHSRDSGGFPPQQHKQVAATDNNSARSFSKEQATPPMLPMYLDDQLALSSPRPPTTTSNAAIDTADSVVGSAMDSGREYKGKSIASSREVLISRDHLGVKESPTPREDPPPSTDRSTGVPNSLAAVTAAASPSVAPPLTDTEDSSRIPPARDVDGAASTSINMEGVYSTAFSPLFSARDTTVPANLPRAGVSRVMFAGQDSIFTRQSVAQGDTLAVAFLYNMQVDVPEEHWPDTYRAFTAIFNDYSLGRLSLQGVCKRALRLFQHYPQLTDEFFIALPYAGFSEYWIGSRDYHVLEHNAEGVPQMLEHTPRGDAAAASILWTGDTPRLDIFLSHRSSFTPTNTLMGIDPISETPPNEADRDASPAPSAFVGMASAPMTVAGPQPREIRLSIDKGGSAQVSKYEPMASGGEWGQKAPSALMAWSRALTQQQTLLGSVAAREAAQRQGGEGAAPPAAEPPLNERQIADIRRKLEQQGIDRGYHLNNWRDISFWLVPKGRGRYISWFTTVATAVMALLFFMMAGQETLVQVQRNASVTQGYDYRQEIADLGTGPYAMWQWATLRPGTERSLSFATLLSWGGRYGPKLAEGQWWRLFTSMVIHQNAVHLLANWVLLLMLGMHLEHHYATWRILMVWLLAGLGGNLASTAFENVCTLVVGSSGAMFGLFGFFMADLVLNFESISFPILRLMLVLLFITFFLVAMLTDKQSDSSESHSSESHWSHIGGLLTGFFSSFLFLPNLKDARWRVLKDMVSTVAAPVRELTMQPTRARADTGLYSFRDAQSFARGYSVRHTRTQAEREQRETRARMLAAVDTHRSFWARFSICSVHPFFILAVAVMVLAYGVLPFYIYNWRLQDVTCT